MSNVTTARDASALEDLAAKLDGQTYVITLVSGAGRRPHLCICNRQAKMLTERIFTDGEFFWWSWAERIAPVSDLDETAAIISRVLQTVTS